MSDQILKTVELKHIHTCVPDGTEVWSGWQLETDTEIKVFKYLDGVQRVVVTTKHELIAEFDIPPSASKGE